MLRKLKYCKPRADYTSNTYTSNTRHLFWTHTAYFNGTCPRKEMGQGGFLREGIRLHMCCYYWLHHLALLSHPLVPSMECPQILPSCSWSNLMTSFLPTLEDPGSLVLCGWHHSVSSSEPIVHNGVTYFYNPVSQASIAGMLFEALQPNDRIELPSATQW